MVSRPTVVRAGRWVQRRPVAPPAAGGRVLKPLHCSTHRRETGQTHFSTLFLNPTPLKPGHELPSSPGHGQRYSMTSQFLAEFLKSLHGRDIDDADRAEIDDQPRRGRPRVPDRRTDALAEIVDVEEDQLPPKR